MRESIDIIYYKLSILNFPSKYEKNLSLKKKKRFFFFLQRLNFKKFLLVFKVSKLYLKTSNFFLCILKLYFNCLHLHIPNQIFLIIPF